MGDATGRSSGARSFPEPRLPTYRFRRDRSESLDDLRASFDWEIPSRFNAATFLCDRWSGHGYGHREAIVEATTSGSTARVSYRELDDVASGLAGHLRSGGVEAGDRIGIGAGQRVSTVAALLATWKLGAIAVPVSPKYGRSAIEHRFDDCGVTACVGSKVVFEAVRGSSIDPVVVVEGQPEDGETRLEHAVDDGGDSTGTHATSADDPALLLYTSGTTGPPKGVVHSHQTVLGMLPTYAVSMCDLDVDTDHLVWVPAAWSWIASLSFVLPALYYGHAVFADANARFDPERTFGHLREHDVSIAFVLHAARRWRTELDEPGVCQGLEVATFGDTDPTHVRWLRETFPNATLHRGYGQTEACLPVGHASALAESPIASIGRAMPGHDVAVVDSETGEPLPADEVGELVIAAEGNPACLDGYWGLDGALSETVHGGWLWTDDLATMDEGGNLFYVARTDDVINCSGYRVGPAEVESALVEHRAVEEAGVIGIEDEERGEVPKAFVVLDGGTELSASLTAELQQLVKDRYAAYGYPREITAVETLPRTNNGKIRRVELRRREGET